MPSGPDISSTGSFHHITNSIHSHLHSSPIPVVIWITAERRHMPYAWETQERRQKPRTAREEHSTCRSHCPDFMHLLYLLWVRTLIKWGRPFQPKLQRREGEGEFNQREAHRTCWKRAPWSNTPPNPDPPVWPAQVLLNTPVSCPSFSPILWLKENLECKYILGLSDPNLQHLVLCCAHSREFAKIQGCKHRTTRGILVN